jgi:hypothetical protein
MVNLWSFVATVMNTRVPYSGNFLAIGVDELGMNELVLISVAGLRRQPPSFFALLCFAEGTL